MTTWMAATYGKSSKLHLVNTEWPVSALCGFFPAGSPTWFDPSQYAIGASKEFVHCKTCEERGKPR